ncbi:hypothetical protein BV140_735 [Haemophilus influenzae]|nr:hypothetical protein BV083_676 [Haemophilus influenzae]AVI97508.1 hypothetical protein BV085_673 [Haemophilus influenzae]AVJ06529.1 hypothetical protein BV139_734 [Haemophilus influenzae]AVJ08362.1 hypothetical protein BV140_735 [Haemophilus influenzae]
MHFTTFNHRFSNAPGFVKSGSHNHLSNLTSFSAIIFSLF